MFYTENNILEYKQKILFKINSILKDSINSISVYGKNKHNKKLFLLVLLYETIKDYKPLINGDETYNCISEEELSKVLSFISSKYGISFTNKGKTYVNGTT
jgi:hypothetical protein